MKNNKDASIQSHVTLISGKRVVRGGEKKSQIHIDLKYCKAQKPI